MSRLLVGVDPGADGPKPSVGQWLQVLEDLKSRGATVADRMRGDHESYGFRWSVEYGGVRDSVAHAVAVRHGFVAHVESVPA